MDNFLYRGPSRQELEECRLLDLARKRKARKRKIQTGKAKKLQTRKVKKLSTVNVIEDSDGQLSVTSFADTTRGNKAAEAEFKAIARENVRTITVATLDEALDDGHLDDGGTWELYLVHT